MESKIIINNKEYTYIIEYKKIKNIYFRVKEDLKIHVSAPKIVSKKYIENLLQKESLSINKMYQRMLNKSKISNDIYYLGNKLDLIIYNGKASIQGEYIYAKDYETAKEYIYSLALDVFTVRLNSIIINFNNLPKFRLRVRKMTTKWGVNNQKSMTITLNTELITKDINLIDYVIVHELCHFYEPNHSPKFWAWVAKYYPYYKLARKELNRS